MIITIYDSTGTPKAELSPNDSSTQVKEIQGDSVLTLSFTHYDHISLDVDDYVDFEGERFWLTEKYRPRQNARKEWVYDIKLYGVESMLKRLLVIKTVDDEDDPVFTLTAPPHEHVAMIVKCMNNGLGNITDWKVGQVDGTENIVIDYFGKYCDEALKEIAEKIGAEAWVEGQTVNICKCEHGEPIPMGYDKGLLSIDPGTADNVKFYTRLYPVGSSRNIDREKYGYSRLQLPGGQKYVEINADKYGRVDHYEKDAFADIYPRRTGSISSVRSEEKTGEDGTPFTIYYFQDNNLPFDPNAYEIGGLVKRVSFQEGSELAGLGEEDNGTYFFEVNFNSSTREFEIITIWPYDNDMQLPGDKLIPKIGDKYILWNLRMPDEYYELAEAEFMSAVDKYNADHNLDISVYKAPTDHVWIEDNGIVLTIGQRIRLESDDYFPETGYRDSRITKITRKVNLPSSMDIEISDALSRTSMQKVSDSISEVRSYAEGIAGSVALPDIIRTGDSTRPTDNNLLSAKRSYADLLRKDRDDRTGHKVASDKGFEVGNYVAGASGAMVGNDAETGQTFGEMDRLFIRVKAYFETLTVINSETLAGKQYITPGGSVKITSVEEIRNVQGSLTGWRCYFLSEQDGEKTETKMIVGDQAISEMFNAKTGTTNKVSNHRYWRLVTAVNNDAYEESGNHYGYIELSKSNCEAGSDVPEAGDVLCQLGYQGTANKERQTAMVFSTVDADAPSIKMYSGITSYSLNDKAIISFGRDPLTNQVYFRLGNSTSKQYLSYTQSGGLELAGSLSVASTIGDTNILDYFGGIVKEETDKYRYLSDSFKKASEQSTQISGGVILSTMVALGYTEDEAHHILSGMNGAYNADLGGRTPAAWYGGNMIDLFDEDDRRITPTPQNGAASMIRMDGSAYFSKGNIGFRKDGSGWLGSEDGIRFSADGSLTLGNGIKINLSSGEQGLKDTLESFANILTYFIPENSQGKQVSWSDGDSIINRIRVTKGFYSDSFISARGRNAEGGTGSGAGFGLMRSWPASAPANTTTDALGANLGWELKQRIDNLPTTLSNKADKTVKISAGTGLTGGGTLEADRTLSLATSGVTAGTYTKLTVDAYGRATAGASLVASDIPALAISKITGLQTALDGKVAKAGDTMTGLLTLNAGAKVASGQKLVIGDCEITWDSANGGLKFSKGIFSEGFVSARGANSAGGGSGASFGRLDSWANYNANGTDALSAVLGYGLKIRIDAMEGKNYLNDLTIDVTGSGNAVTSVSQSADKKTLTFNKGTTFLTAHQSLAAYLKIDGSNGTAAGVSALLNKLTTGDSTPVDNDYYISQYVNGGTATTTYHRRPMSALWTYIKAKGGSGSGLDADLLDGVHDGELTARAMNMTALGVATSVGDISALKTRVFDGGTSGDYAYSAILSVSNGQGSRHFLLFNSRGNEDACNLKWRGVKNDMSGYNSIRTIVDSYNIKNYNAGSATKLQTARTIWGQSFDGTRDVSGNMTGVGSMTMTDSIVSSKTTTTHIRGNQGHAIINSTASAGAYTMLAKMNSTNGYFTEGVYKTEYHLYYTAKNVVDAGTNTITHSIALLDESGLTSLKKLKIGSITLEDVNGNLHIDKGVYSDSFISARGANSSGGSSGGTSYNRLDSWADYASGKSGYVLSALLGYDLHTRVQKIEGKNLVTIGTDGVSEVGKYIDFHSSNYGTGNTEDYTVRLDASANTAAARFYFPATGGTFATEAWVTGKNYLTSHQSLANYVDKTSAQTITGDKTFNLLKIANSGYGTERPSKGIAVNGILGTMASNDYWAIFGYGTASDSGYLEIATGDNGNEPIYVGQYSGGSPLSASSTRSHGITLMNAAGNQVFNEVTGSKFIKTGGASNQVLMADGSLQTHWLAASVTSATSDNGMITPLAMNNWTSKTFLKLSGGTMSNTNRVVNLNADLLDGYHALSFPRVIQGMVNTTGTKYILLGSFNYENSSTTGGASFNIRGSIGRFGGVQKNVLDITVGNRDGVGFNGFISNMDSADWDIGVNNARQIFLILKFQWITYDIEVFSRQGTLVDGTTATPTDTNFVLLSSSTLVNRFNNGKFLGSAASLTTARTLWGQSFNGTADVSGDITSVGKIYGTASIAPYMQQSAVPSAVGNLGTAIGIGSAPSNYGMFMWGDSTGKGHIQVGRKDGTQTAYNLILQEFGGNVGIGTSSPTQKLDVHGNIQAIMLYAGTTATNGSIEIYHATPYIDFHFGRASADYTTRIIEEASGRLKIIGALHTTVGMYSDGYVSARGQNTSSDSRLKNNLSPMMMSIRDIASAPCVEFRWRDNNQVDVGSIAQYWQAISPYLTPEGKDGYLTLQYGKTALLSVITIAREVVSHEQRIEKLEKENSELKAELSALKAR